MRNIKLRYNPYSNEDHRVSGWVPVRARLSGEECFPRISFTYDIVDVLGPGGEVVDTREEWNFSLTDERPESCPRRFPTFRAPYRELESPVERLKRALSPTYDYVGKP